jgi:hypothetical protein
MRLIITERKRALHEQDEESTIEVNLSPRSYLKLTTLGESFKIIDSFMMERKYEECLNLETAKERQKFIIGFFMARKKPPAYETLSEEQKLAVNLLIGAMNFIKPASDRKGWGAFDEEKAGTMSLYISVERDGTGKVSNHEGRNRSLYLWMKGVDDYNISVTFNAKITAVSEMPYVIKPQFESKFTVPKSDFKPPKGDESGPVKIFRTVEGFMNFWNNLRHNKGSMTIDDFVKKFNEENTITVGGRDAVVMKAIEVFPSGPFKFGGFYIFGLYHKEAKELKAGDMTDTDQRYKYYSELASLRFKDAEANVQVSKI